MSSARWGFIALTAFAAAATGTAVAAGNPVLGKQKAYTCGGCHDIPGYNTTYPEYHVPKLGGQHADYIVSALKEYKSGARIFPTMQEQASALSDQDMEDIAAYFSTAPAR